MIWSEAQFLLTSKTATIVYPPDLFVTIPALALWAAQPGKEQNSTISRRPQSVIYTASQPGPLLTIAEGVGYASTQILNNMDFFFA